LNKIGKIASEIKMRKNLQESGNKKIKHLEQKKSSISHELIEEKKIS
jgi:hypothetical protein